MNLYKFGRVIVGLFFKTVYRVRVEGTENIPKDRNFVVCANHKSNLDPPLLGLCMPFEIRYMAKEELFKNKFFGALIRALGAFPIKRGKSDVGALRAAMKMIKSGEVVAVFPEGGRSHKDCLRRGKQGAALIALKTEVDILPVGICGTYKPFAKMVVRIGTPIQLDAYFDKKTDSEDLQRITDQQLMPAISKLSGEKLYENRNS